MKKISIIGFVLGSFVATAAIGGVPGATKTTAEKTSATTPQQQSQQQTQEKK